MSNPVGMSLLSLRDVLSVGIIQTTVDAKLAWRSGIGPLFTMARPFQERSWNQIREAVRTFCGGERKPDLILLPELAVPRSRLRDLKKLGQSANAVIIAGCDYAVDKKRKTVRNEAIVLVPDSWERGTFRRSRRSRSFVVGKTFASRSEEDGIRKQSYTFQGESNVYVFHTYPYANFGVCICYDLMDLERALMYRGHIAHLFVLAYNKDIGSFYQLAEASARTIYCNVVICNTGFYGGSLATTVRYTPQVRTVYRHEGARLFTSQIIELPVKSMVHVQYGELQDDVSGERLYKGLPPNYQPPRLLRDLLSG